MHELEFHIGAKIKRPLRFDKKPRRRLNGRVVFVAVVVAASAALAVRDMRRGGRAARVASVHGREVWGERAVVLVDDSPSTLGTEAESQAQLASLAAAGISITHRADIPGFAISFTNFYGFLPVLQRELDARPQADVVYVISDFTGSDDAANDLSARQQLQRLLARRHARIYWATLRDDPPPEYYAIARQTGGDVIPKR